MPSAEDLIKKVINNNTVKVQIMTPELEKKFEEMEERQTEQHEETLQSQKKTEDAIKSSRGSDSSNFKEGGEMINKGIKGLTGVDIGGKFNDLKEKMGDLGNIFKGFGRLLKIQGFAEAGGATADILGYGLQKQELSVTEKLKQSIDKQTRLGEKERKSVVASRIQKEQPENIQGIQEQLEILGASQSDIDIVKEEFSKIFEDISKGDALKFDEITGELSQDKDARNTFVEGMQASIKGLENVDINSLGEEFRDAFDKNIKDFVENASRLAYELRSVDLNPEGQLEIDPSKDNFGGLRITPEGEFFENPKGVLEGLNEESIERFETPFKQLGEEQKKSLLSEFNVKQDFIDSYSGDAQAAVDAISRNTVESVEVLRNTFAKSFEPLVQQENLGQELKQNKTVMSENVNDEQSQMMMNFLSNLPPILAVLKDQLDMDEDQKDKLFGGQKKTGSIVDVDGNPISSDDFKSPMGGIQDALAQGSRGFTEAILQGTAMGTASATAQKTFSGQKPTKTPPNKPGTTAPKGTGAPVKAGGIMGMLRGVAGGIVGFLGGTAGVVALGAALVGAGIYANTGNEKDNEDLGEGDSDYAKRKKEELDQKRTELQGDETNFFGMQKITSESIIDDNTFEGGQGFFDTLGNLWNRESEIYFDKLNQDDALLRLDQLMAADDLIGDDLSKEDRKRLDQELRDAQTAAQKQLEEMQSETGERLTLEELGKYYDFEVLGENMLKNIQPPQSVTDNSVINNNTTITSANPRQYDNDIDRAQGAVYT